MNRYGFFLYHFVIALCFFISPRMAVAVDGDADSGVEVLTRGPIHEAFAQPITMDEEDKYIITRPPPALIEEIPPDEKPEGENIVWIPGYWGWDDDLDDFVWISGCWRAVPPNCSWVPGYWRQVEDGYEWVSGFWNSASKNEITYLPAPPVTLERGPAVPAASAEYTWVPGCWVWQPAGWWRPGRYVWRPGFWLLARNDWIWIQAHYVWTPHGYVFVEGYWDYTIPRRGMVFMPVHCPRNVFHVGFRFSPHIVFDISFFTRNLFCSPRRHHYYFGDYYDAKYVSRGYQPWFEVRSHNRSYDPIFVHEQWRYRDDRNWAQKQRTEYEHRRDHQDARPPRTYKDMETQVRRLPDQQRREAQMARPLKDAVQDRDRQVKFEKLDTPRRDEAAGRGDKLRIYKQQRAQWESPSTSRAKGADHKEDKAPQEPDRKTTRPSPVKKPSEVIEVEPGPVRKETVAKPAGEAKTSAPRQGKTSAPSPARGKEQPAETARPSKPSTVKTPASPIGSERKSRGRDDSPPPAPKLPKVNTKASSSPAKEAPAGKDQGRGPSKR